MENASGYSAGSDNIPLLTVSSTTTHAAFRFIRADFEQSVASWGSMETHAKVDAVYEDGETVNIVRTLTDYTGDRTPIWNHLSCWDLRKSCKCVLQMRVKMIQEVLGTCSIQLDDIINKGIRTLDLKARDAESVESNVHSGSTITVEVFSFSLPELLSCSEVRVDTHLFKTPVSPISKSGGTAAFYNLQLNGVPDDEASCWIGKDLKHAPQEKVFYTGRDSYFKAFEDVHQEDQSKLADLLKFMFQGKGVLHEVQSSESPSESKMDLLVLENLFHSCRDLRMLDIKIGQRTAAPNWYGKSMIRAMQFKPMDKYTTNSGSEGFRLAGFNGQPSSFTSRDPIHDMPSVSHDQDEKRSKTLVVGNLSGNQFVRYFMDMHDKGLPSDATKALIPDEVLEISLNEMASKLVALTLACKKVVVPQKWVGSSVCIGFDTEQSADRSNFAETQRVIRDKVKVKIFDWGRSELNTMANHLKLSEEEKQDRAKYWQYYVEGIDRLVWDFLRSYRQRYCNVGSLMSLKCEVYDYDADVISKVNPDEYCGEVDLPLRETHGMETVNLKIKGSGKEAGKLTYSMSYKSLPEDSRFQGFWQVTMSKASGLPAMDRLTLHSKSDPYVVLSATTRAHPQAGTHAVFVSKQQGAVVMNSLNPDFRNETFCIPIASEDGLIAALDASAPRLISYLGNLDSIFPNDDASEASMSKGRQLWIEALNTYVVKEGKGAPVGRVVLMGDIADHGAGKALDAAKEAVTKPLEFASHLKKEVSTGMGTLFKSLSGHK